MNEIIICTACAREFEIISLDEWQADSVAECAYCGHPHSKQIAAQQLKKSEKRPQQEDEMNSFEQEIQKINDDIDASDARIGNIETRRVFENPVELEIWALKRCEIKATLLLAEQMRRIAQVLENHDGTNGFDVSNIDRIAY